MFNRVLAGIQSRQWLQSKYIVQKNSYPSRSLCNSEQHYSKQGDDEKSPALIPTKPEQKPEFQFELNQDSYCPPLATPIKTTLHPIKRALDIAGITGRNDPYVQKNIGFPRHSDIVIIGGGVMGCSIAYWLKQRGHDNGLNIVVVERDPSYTRASTVLSVGGLRQQFSLPENVQMSLYGAEFLRQSQKLLSGENLEGPDVQFNPYGYLFLASQNGADQLIANHKLQMSVSFHTIYC